MLIDGAFCEIVLEQHSVLCEVERDVALWVLESRKGVLC